MENYLIFLCFVGTTAYATNYCDLSCGTIPNIGCNNNKKFVATCPPDIRMVTLTEELKKVLIDGHNDIRNKHAGGTGAKNSSTCKMATMEWDEELAELASLNIKKCVWAHDDCHKTAKYEYSGQNIAEYALPQPVEFNDTEVLLAQMTNWYNEITDSKPSDIDSIPSDSAYVLTIGHFAMMASEYNNRLGCASAIYSETYEGELQSVYKTTCNYDRVLIADYPIYFRCEKAASSCKTGKNPRFPNLCSTTEKYDVNKVAMCENCVAEFVKIY